MELHDGSLSTYLSFSIYVYSHISVQYHDRAMKRYSSADCVFVGHYGYPGACNYRLDIARVTSLNPRASASRERRAVAEEREARRTRHGDFTTLRPEIAAMRGPAQHQVVPRTHADFHFQRGRRNYTWQQRHRRQVIKRLY